ncbi:MAG: FumA C-terminus/TtdB family hydratase beta subunit [Elusimicrobiota bacterium]|jgi:fumarate hydratase subunit beta|nr:FumA C-terminus/TtdB family hydratase beta subunit [Elusimicrobiota bacterium]
MTTRLKTPLTVNDLKPLRHGQEILISGIIYAFRDAAHKRMLEENKIPVNLKNQIIYYTGPTPTRPGRTSGSCGPTTSARMDKYTPQIIKKTGIIGIIGKGKRNEEARLAMKGRVVYFTTYSGLGALIAKCVKKSEIIAYADLGAEAIYKLEVENFPLITAYDINGKGEIK